MRTKLGAVFLTLSAMVGASACTPQTAEPTVHTFVAKESATSDLFASLQSYGIRPSLGSVTPQRYLQARQFAQLLPNVRFTKGPSKAERKAKKEAERQAAREGATPPAETGIQPKKSSGVRASDVVVAGRVSWVTPFAGLRAEGDSWRRVEFDAPEAQRRLLLVHLRVGRSSGAEIDSDFLSFVVELPPSGIDQAREAGAAMAALDDVMVLLTQSSSEATENRWVLDQPLLLAVTDDQGGLRLPGLGNRQDFLGGLRTVDQVMSQAASGDRKLSPKQVKRSDGAALEVLLR